MLLRRKLTRLRKCWALLDGAIHAGAPALGAPMSLMFPRFVDTQSGAMRRDVHRNRGKVGRQVAATGPPALYRSVYEGSDRTWAVRQPPLHPGSVLRGVSRDALRGPAQRTIASLCRSLESELGGCREPSN